MQKSMENRLGELGLFQLMYPTRYSSHAGASLTNWVRDASTLLVQVKVWVVLLSIAVFGRTHPHIRIHYKRDQVELAHASPLRIFHLQARKRTRYCSKQSNIWYPLLPLAALPFLFSTACVGNPRSWVYRGRHPRRTLVNGSSFAPLAHACQATFPIFSSPNQVHKSRSPHCLRQF